MFLSEIKIIDLKRSKFDTSELDSLIANLKKLEKDFSSLKSPVQIKDKDGAITASCKRALVAHAKKSKDFEAKISEAKDKIAELETAEKKARAKGQYKFKKKVYTDKPMADTTGGLDFGYKFKWGHNDAKDISTWKVRDGFELVTAKDPYLPEEPTALDAEGKFIFGDAVLMKITLRKYAEKQMLSQAKSDKAVASRLKEFQATLASKGVEASDEFIGDWKKQLGIDD